MKMLTWMALPARAPGTARRTRAQISGVIRGSRQCTCAPDFLTPHVSTSACDTPAASTPHEAMAAAPDGVWVGSTVTRVQMLSRIGAPADKMNRLRAFSTPERCA